MFAGRLLNVDVEVWPAGEREVVRHPGACAVVALTPDGDVLLVRQFREAIRKELLEIPAGIFDVEGETGAECAARELLEETGYRATMLEPLCSIYTSPGFTDERIEIYLAEAEPSGVPADEPIEVVIMPLSDTRSAIERGDIVDAKTVVGLLLVRT